MAVTNLLNPNQIKQEIVVFLRTGDIFSIGTRGVSTETDEAVGTGDDVETKFALDNTNVKNIRNVKVDGSTKVYGTDYTMDYTNAEINFVVAPGSGLAITSTYDYGSGDKIYPDYPRPDLSLSSYPRIAIAITSMATSEMALGAKSNMSDLLISVTVYADGMETVDGYVKDIRELFLEAKDDFYYLEFITPITQSPLINEPRRGDKIHQRTLELRSLFNVETIS